MSITILSTDTYQTIAKKIWGYLQIGGSIQIHGWSTNEISQMLSPTGDLVVDHLKYLDEVDNIKYTTGGKKYRNYEYPKNYVGGPLLQKGFKWEKVFVDKVPRVTIWRIQ